MYLEPESCAKGPAVVGSPLAEYSLTEWNAVLSRNRVGGVNRHSLKAPMVLLSVPFDVLIGPTSYRPRPLRHPLVASQWRPFGNSIMAGCALVRLCRCVNR
jgi:hypothetical protein